MSIRMLLSGGGGTDLTNGCLDPYAALTEAASGHDSHDKDEAFIHIYYVMVFVASLWFAGKIFVKFGMPALVGEIVFGIVLGPHLINLAGDHGSEFLIVVGEIGLVMLVVEAGIDVDIGMLKLIGPRGLGVAVMGSIMPMSFGFCISYLFMGTTLQSSIAIGACFAPTSMGIALNVLKKAKILNTPTGQLIIAAAILDDVIALIILSELTAMKDPTPSNILLPLIVSPILILGIGYLAIKWIPHWIKMLMNKIPKQHRENSILALLFMNTFAFVPMCHFLGSSHLLGAFLAGLCFCTDHTIHHVWKHQIKRVLQWMLRIFFAATIGFAIPIRDFGTTSVILRGIIYCFCAIGKIATGFFSRPLTKREFYTVGFSMSAWGEFAFILATASFAEGTIDQESFSSVLLAVLLSVILSPYALSFTISYYEKQAQKRMDEHLKKYEDTNLHPLYFAINTKARGQWGHQDKILHRIFNLQLEIIDFRSWHAPEFNHSHHQPLTKESFYVQDMITALPPTKHLDSHENRLLLDRAKQIRTELRDALGDKAVIAIKRWLPGVTKKDDQLEPTDDYIKSMFGGEYKPKHNKTPEYCRREAFKQAHSMISLFERKSTLEDIARKSKQSLHSMHSLHSLMSLRSIYTIRDMDNNNGYNSGNNGGGYNTSTNVSRKNTIEQFEKDMAENSLTFSDSPEPKNNKHKKTRSVDIGTDGNNTNGIKLRGTNSNPTSPRDRTLESNWSKNANRNKKQLMNHIYHSGAGHQGQMGGVGALPFNNDIIDIQAHFQNDDDDDLEAENERNKNEDMSYMSYIYGDEDSQHHKLPEYSVEHLPEFAVENLHFQPTLPQLKENNNNNKSKKEDDKKVEEEQEDDDNTKTTNNNNSNNNNNNSIESHVSNPSDPSSQHESISIGKDSKNKLTIKIYPPALKPVPSTSPIGDDIETPHQYID